MLGLEMKNKSKDMIIWKMK